MMPGSEGHSVRFDFGGFRVTCTGPGHEQATMRLDDSALPPEKLTRVEAFFRAHPPIDDMVTDADRQGQPECSRTTKSFIEYWTKAASYFKN